jgi:CBS domain-containing protein
VSKAPDTIGEIMTRNVVVVAPTDTVERALRAMLDRDIGSVVVEEGGSAVGVFTERDVTRRIVDDPDLLARPVSVAMSAPVVSIGPQTEVVEAFELMNANGIRRLPVLEDGRLAGIVTERDLLRWVGQVARE